MSLLLRHLRVRTLTDIGLFGTDIPFELGLNILHAPNNSGKSSCLMAMLYALGLEGAFTSRQSPPLPPALTNGLQDQNGEVRPVVQSWVELEIENDSHRIITVRRPIKDPVRDHRLVSVVEGPSLTMQANDGTRPVAQDLYVRRSGAAREEGGFHRFLAEFLGYDLPEVPKFDGSRVPLYLECLVPLFYVEQKTGWRSVQLRMPTYLGIRDVSRRAIEFLLNLDAAQKEIERQRLSDRRRSIAEHWKSVREAHLVGLRTQRARVSGVPEDVVPSLGGLHDPRLHVLLDNDWLLVDAAQSILREQHSDIVHREIPTVSEVAEQLEARLSELRSELHDVSVRHRAVELEVQVQQEEIRAADRRLRVIEIDLRRNQEAKKLADMGAEGTLVAGDGSCPTCGQSVVDSLLRQDPDDIPMSLEDNIEYLRGQARLFDQVRADAMKTLVARKQQLDSLRADAASLRRDIRAVIESLNADGRLPSIEAVRQRLRLEDRLEELQEAREIFQNMLTELGAVADECREIDAAIARLGPAGPSESDGRRLREIELSICRRLRDYGFTSVPPNEVQLSHTLYRPVHDGFDLSFDVSASDMIRVIWAYLLGLLEAGTKLGGRHPGLLVFDEPKQQGARAESFVALLHHASAAAVDGKRQILFATSEDRNETVAGMRALAANFIAFNGPMLRLIETFSAEDE